jgi:photosystem II stability/assembly factor-like uncharacterized protein
MTPRLLILTLFAPFLAFSQEGNFKWQNPLPQGNELNCCCCSAGHIAWAVGNAGTILKSTDKGLTWNLQNSGLSSRLCGVFFIDSLKGWACGDQTILNTIDGGETWHLQSIPDSSYLNDIQFLDDHTGWAVGNNWKIIRTTDGGQNWIDQGYFTQKSLNSVCFVDYQTGYAAGTEGSFLITHNGGASWLESQAFNDEYYLSSVFFISQDTGWTCGNFYNFPGLEEVILKTVNGGLTWSQYLPGNVLPVDICFTDHTHGYISSISSVLETNDAGETWIDHTWIDNKAYFFNSISFFDQSSGLCVGENSAVLRQLPPPDTAWVFTSPGNTEYLRDIEFVNHFEGWAIGYYNTILHTSDAGETWTPYPPGDTLDYSYWLSVEFTDSLHGWICGSGGDLINTRDGGLTWSKYDITPYVNLNSMFFLDSNFGWVVGDGDIRLKTVDGGHTWNGFPSYMWNTYDVFFIDAMTGWVVGSNGFINKTYNGGINWVMQYSNTTSALNSVWFTDSLNGWIVGDDVTVLHTTDGGESWLPQSVPGNDFLFDIYFLNDLEGWITGYTGVILHTTDGGLNWTEESIITDQSLNSMCFLDVNNGWICGSNGTILAYKPENPVNIPDINKNKETSLFDLSPNPCNSLLSITLYNNIDKISFYDQVGRLRKKIDIDHESPIIKNLSIDISDLSPGVYLVKAESAQGSESKKLIISR